MTLLLGATLAIQFGTICWVDGYTSLFHKGIAFVLPMRKLILWPESGFVAASTKVGLRCKRGPGNNTNLQPCQHQLPLLAQVIITLILLITCFLQYKFFKMNIFLQNKSSASASSLQLICADGSGAGGAHKAAPTQRQQVACSSLRLSAFETWSTAGQWGVNSVWAQANDCSVIYPAKTRSSLNPSWKRLDFHH